MELIFFLVAFTYLAYFLFVERSFDFFSIAYFSAIIYFLPGFFGFVGNASVPEMGVYEISEATYWVFLSVLSIIFVSAFVYDHIFTVPRGSKVISDYNPSFLFASLIVALSGLVITVWVTGDALLQPGKQFVDHMPRRGYFLWCFGASLGLVYAFLHNKVIYIGTFFVLLGGTVFIGFRSSFAIALIAVFVILLFCKGPQRLALANWKQCLIGGGLGFLIIIYKPLYKKIKKGDWEHVVDRLTDSNYYLQSVSQSEPFTIQLILNKIIESDFHLNSSQLDVVWLNLGVFLNRFFEITVKPFNTQFQTELFPDVTFGMAGNIWAQMWAFGGLTGVVLFVSFFCIILMVLNRFLLSKNAITLSTVSLMGAYWSFFIHRNELGFQINLEKRVLIVCLLIITVSYLIKLSIPILNHLIDRICINTTNDPSKKLCIKEPHENE